MNQNDRSRINILDELRRHTASDPDRTLFTFHEADGAVRRAYSYGAFVQRVEEIASHLVTEGAVEPGDQVILLYPPGLEMLGAFFACVRLGAIPVPVSPPSSHGYEASMTRLGFIADDCGARVILTGRAYFWSMKLWRLRDRITRRTRDRDPLSDLRWVITTDSGGAPRRSIPEGHSSVLFLQYTSGSTGNPRGVMVTHENVLANCGALFDHGPTGVSWLPQYHDMGLIGCCLFVAVSGGSSHLFSPLDFLRRPILWLEAITRFRATASAAPNFAYQFCLHRNRIPEEALSGVDLSSLRLLLNGAEPVRPDIMRAFRARFEPYGLRPDALSAAYGLAEHTLAVSGRGIRSLSLDAEALGRGCVSQTGEETTTEVMSCGRPLPGTEVEIVDLSGVVPTPAAPGRVGEIWVRGPSRCIGYWNRPRLSEATFGARLAGDTESSEAWLRTGDLGFLHDGELFVCGRKKDLIIIRGLNYYPQDIEAVVGEHPDIRTGCVAAIPLEEDGREILGVVAEVRGGRPPESVEVLNAALRRALGIVAERFIFISKRTIPKTSSGKIRRRSTRDRLLRGELTIIADVRRPPAPALPGDLPASSSPDAGYWGTDAGLQATLRRRGLTGFEDGTVADVGLDSLATAEFARDLERHLEAAGAPGLSDAMDLRWLQRISVSELVALLRDVLAATSGARLRFLRALSELRTEHRRSEQEMMRRDVEAGLPAAGGEGEPPSSKPRRGILLTGGTGFFGPFLLRSLLNQYDDPIYVLVRAPDDVHAEERLDDALGSLGPDLGTMALRTARERIIPVRGDLGRPDLGLSRRAWRRLATGVHTVYHNGAEVNYLKDYADLRPSNVLGTREVLRLAAEGRPTAVNHVSTTFVFGWSTRDILFEDRPNDDLDLLDFGYSQSKWVSERLMLQAVRDGLPGRIFRPALIAPSLCGWGRSFDIAMRMLVFMLKHGIGTTARNQVSMSPADVVADNIVAISHLPDTLGQSFHVTRDV